VADVGKQNRTATSDPPVAATSASEPHSSPGKTTLTGALPVISAPVQRKADPTSERFDDAGVHQAAAAGVAGGGGPLPHLDRIQAAFGPMHDVTGTGAHIGGSAASAADQIGARAYATGNQVAFREAPDLHTAAHEAAHVVQQRGGVQLKGGVGSEGDPHERHADAVADKVVRGESAGDLLAAYRGDGATAGVQRDGDARELGADERVVSKDPTYAADAYLPWFRDQIKAKLTAWDLAFDPAAVKLATLKLGGASVKAVVIGWNAAWGTIPITREFPLTLTPLDARAALTAVHALAGWSKVASDQGVIDNLLGGEENALSAAARNHLRPTYKTLKTKTDTEQATALKGTLNVKDAMPGWTAEPMEKQLATVTLAGPTEKKDFEFTGKKADGEEWVATFSDGVSTKIVAPKAPTAGYHNHSVQEAANAACFLPKSARSLITLIMLNPVVNPKDAEWAVTYNTPNFHSYMTAGVAGVVTIYPDKETNALPAVGGQRSAIVHETGHTWSYKTWGQDKTKGKWVDWKKAMGDDKTSVSGYAMSAIAEDVAETIRVYVSNKDTPRFAEYQNIVPHRFEILKKEYDK
jgi:hypothetical protein